jgi:hypothetical protein
MVKSGPHCAAGVVAYSDSVAAELQCCQSSQPYHIQWNNRDTIVSKIELVEIGEIADVLNFANFVE